jgi:hypothetical protein
MLFDDVRERDELREIARVKDSLAGLQAAVINRYFLTARRVLHLPRGVGLRRRPSRPAAGVLDPVPRRGRAVLPSRVREREDLEFQAAQIKAVTLRRNGRLRFEGVRAS